MKLIKLKCIWKNISRFFSKKLLQRLTLSHLSHCFFLSVTCASSSIMSTGPTDHRERSPMGWGMFPPGQASPRASGTPLLQRLQLFQAVWLGYKSSCLRMRSKFPVFSALSRKGKTFCSAFLWTANSHRDGMLGHLFFRIRSKNALALHTFTKSCSPPLCSPASETWQIKWDRCILTCLFH